MTINRGISLIHLLLKLYVILLYEILIYLRNIIFQVRITLSICWTTKPFHNFNSTYNIHYTSYYNFGRNSFKWYIKSQIIILITYKIVITVEFPNAKYRRKQIKVHLNLPVEKMGHLYREIKQHGIAVITVLHTIYSILLTIISDAILSNDILNHKL
jgi:hypothetical protein